MTRVICYNAALARPSNPRAIIMNVDFTLRALILFAGGIAAIVLSMKGYGTALPAVAVGGAVGAFFASRVQAGTTSEE